MENAVTCPYAEADCPRQAAPGGECPKCARFLKTCAACRTHNRAFANFCRSCGVALPPSPANWPGFKGGARRLGVTSLPLAVADGQAMRIVPTTCQIRLDDLCRSLLGYDGHLIAISGGGTIAVADPRRPQAGVRVQTQGPINAEPCLDGGILYVGSPRQMSAWSLAAMHLASGGPRLLWQIPLSGTPIQALTLVGGRLYFTVNIDGLREVQMIESLDRPVRAQTVYRAPYTAVKVSWLAGDPDEGTVAFLTEDESSGVQLHTVASGSSEVVTHGVDLSALGGHPIALHGGHVYCIFGTGQSLTRLDARRGTVADQLGADTLFFSLAQNGHGSWGQDVVRVDSNGIHFPQSGVHDAFTHVDRAVKGSPLIVQGRAAVVGMQDGRVLVYDLLRPPLHDVWRVGSGTSAVTALSAFDRYLAAGNADGFVDVVELR